MISLKIIKGNETIDISDFLSDISWSGDSVQAARQINFTLISSAYDKNVPDLNLNVGNTIIFFENNKELFRGYIFLKNTSYNSTTITYTAYDLAIYTLKNESSYNFKNVTAEQATKRICSDFNLQAGSLAKTNININKKFIGVNIYEIIMSCYTIAFQNNNKKYMILAKDGKLNVIEKGNKVLDLVFENGFNLIETTISESLEQMINRVRIVDKDGNLIKEISDNNDLKTYGSFQKSITQSEGKDESKRARSLLQGIDNKISITGFGDNSCITGNAVKVYDNYTKVTGLFYIESDKHTWKDGIYTVDLVLKLENVMNESERGSDYE